MIIPYKTHKFTHLPLEDNLSITWSELVWAAVSYGKSSSFYHLKHPWHSWTEMKHRTYLLYTCLKQQGNYLVKSDLYNEMDTTEKGAASYFLGMTFIKLFADRLLDIPLLWHVSTSSQAISYVSGKSRPDLIGCSKSLNEWVVAEAKGRSGAFNQDALYAAKNQSQKITTINGMAPKHRFGAESYFSPHLCLTLMDPPSGEDAIPIEFNIEQALAEYYSIRTVLKGRGARLVLRDIEYSTIYDEDLGVTIGLPQKALGSLSLDWINHIIDREPTPSSDSPLEHFGKDELLIRLDQKWSEEKMKKEPHEREV
jgi:hypothetical protein